MLQYYYFWIMETDNYSQNFQRVKGVEGGDITPPPTKTFNQGVDIIQNNTENWSLAYNA